MTVAQQIRNQKRINKLARKAKTLKGSDKITLKRSVSKMKRWS